MWFRIRLGLRRWKCKLLNWGFIMLVNTLIRHHRYGLCSGLFDGDGSGSGDGSGEGYGEGNGTGNC